MALHVFLYLHACIACSLKPSVDWIAASNLEDETAKLAPEDHATAWEALKNAACVLVPGGFGDRGVKGMMLAAKYARENKVPYRGICLGMQISIIEYARSVLGWEKANSTEFDNETPNPVVHIFQSSFFDFFIFLHACIILYSLFISRYHNSEYVDERHRHRYEVNPDMIDMLEEAGLKFVGKDESGKRMEAVLETVAKVTHEKGKKNETQKAK